MKVMVNGDSHTVDEGIHVDDVLVLLGRDRRGLGLAVAVNGEIVPRAEWDAYEISADDKVEVLHAIGGG